MKKTTLTGVFTPKTKKDSVKFQKLAIALGFTWKKAGAKVISLSYELDCVFDGYGEGVDKDEYNIIIENEDDVSDYIESVVIKRWE